MKFHTVVSEGPAYEVEFFSLNPEQTFEVMVDGEKLQVLLVSETFDELVLRIDGRSYLFRLHPGADTTSDVLRLLHNNTVYKVSVKSEFDPSRSRVRASHQRSGPVVLTSQLPGVVRQVFLEAGSNVKAGQAILTLEAMKMENQVSAEISGHIEAIFVQPGQVVGAQEPLVRIVPEG